MSKREQEAKIEKAKKKQLAVLAGAAKKERIELRAEDEKRVLSLVLRPGRYRTLVVDPPWDYEWLSLAGRAKPSYATMTHAQLLALDVAQWAEDDCHLYLWTTNNFMTRAVELMARWGWQHKTVLTWIKPKFGLGSYFRNSTEHILFGVRGELRTRSDSIPTHFEVPVLGHSEKPEKFYEIVRAASYPPYGEVFQRTARADFTNTYPKVGGSMKHPDQMDQFERDNEWQCRMRDYILVPEFYESRWPGNYQLIKYGDPRAVGGCDTICNGKRIDEKIVRWPNRPEGPYTAYALEIVSCSVPGRERAG